MLPNEMPDDGAQNPASASPTEPAAAPQYATRDEVLAIAESMKALALTIQQGHASQAAPPATPTPTYDDPTMEQITTDLQNGDAKSLQKYLENHERKLVDRVVRPMEQKGYSAIAQQAERIAMNDPNMPHYARFKKEINEVMKPCSLEQRADPLAYQTAYNIVVGMNYEKLRKEEVEAAIRKATESADGGTAPSGAKPKYAEGVPSVKDLLGEQAERELANAGWTPDQWAQKFYASKDWPEAAAKIQAFNAAQGANA